MSIAGLAINYPKPRTDLSPLELQKVEEHEFNTAINAFSNEGINLGQRFIKDSNARARYKSLIESASEQFRSEVMSGQLTYKVGAERAHAMRNELMHIVRETSSDVGRVFATKLKEDGLSFDFLLNKGSQKLFTQEFSALTFDSQRQRVFLAIIESAGTGRDSVHNLAKFLGKSGKVLGVVNIAVVIYDICEANDKWAVAKQEVTGFALGSMFSMAGGWAGMACGPGAFFCVPLGVFIVGAIGALGSDHFYHWSR